MQEVLEESPVQQKQMAMLLNALHSLKRGEHGVRLPVEWTGVAGRVADAFNEVVDMNERMSSELGRINKVVGKEGRITQRLFIGNVSGFWEESVSSVNELIDDLVHPTTETARVIGAVAKGDLTQTMALEAAIRRVEAEMAITNSLGIREGRPYLISGGTLLQVENRALVQRSDLIASLIYERQKTGDIVQGLPRVEELLEGRKRRAARTVRGTGDQPTNRPTAGEPPAPPFHTDSLPESPTQSNSPAGRVPSR